MRKTVIVVIMQLLMFFSIAGQSTVWTTPDKSITVSVPVPLKRAVQYNWDLISNSEKEEGYNSIATFTGERDGITFLVQVLQPNALLKSMKVSEKLEGLEFIVGGDDDQDYIEIWDNRGGLHTRELSYRKQNVRFLSIDGGDRIYVLAMTAKHKKSLVSVVAEKFFQPEIQP